MSNPLTRKQREALTLLRQGVSQSEAAHRLGIVDSAFKQRLSAARMNLKANNTVHAMAEAVSRGYIQ